MTSEKDSLIQRKQRRKKQLENHLSRIQEQAMQNANDFQPNSLYDDNGLPQ